MANQKRILCAILLSELLLPVAAARAVVPRQNGLLTFSRLDPGDLSGQVAIAAAEENAEVSIVTSVGTLNGDSAWSPDGACVVFYSNRDGGDAELYAMSASGDDQTRLTVYPAFDYWGVFSPDGTRLVFVSDRDGEYELYLFDLANGATRQLTKNDAIDFVPAWSPDGAKIAFSSNRDGDYEIYVMNADGTSPTRLTESPGMDIYPDWSPDNDRIAFATERSGAVGRDLWIMDVDGNNERSLVSLNGNQSEPAFSPDGTLIAFSSDTHIFLASSTDGSGLVQVTNDDGVDDRGPDWQTVGGDIAAGLCPTVTPKICGDANADGSIKASDALAVLKKGVASPVVCPKIRCDTDDSGSIVASDALRVLRVSVGQTVELDCPEVES
ncbi:MAG TPA: DPP IV N-terminal domain-containing protein [Candidatus Limnocylindrales bacterium]|nr:DPP IV N-terminal domain-containing protein [Candidatus Limnocylindrales bacterium]